MYLYESMPIGHLDFPHASESDLVSTTKGYRNPVCPWRTQKDSHVEET